MPDIFLSYSRQDLATARQFADALAIEGFDLWWDTDLKSGEAYDEVTEAALRGAKAVVVLWSKRSVVSRWVRAEATVADRNRSLIPAMIEACERPIMFELTQTADLTHWTGDRADPAWSAFLGDVRRFVGATTPGRPAAVQAAAPAQAEPPPATPSRASQGRPSLAVLPFTNRSGEPADDVFAVGMVEDIIAALSTARGVKVIARSATAGYRKDVSDLRTIGRELGARYILEGNVRRVGETLRVTAQLVEAENGAILWTEKFDRRLVELALLQEDLVTEVAGHLGVEVARIEMDRALKKPSDLTAWEAVMRAWASYAHFGIDSYPLAVTEARRAIALAPDYAVAHATLSMALANLFEYGAQGHDPALQKEAWFEGDRAIALEPANANVLYPVAHSFLITDRQSDALALAERALELSPNNAAAHHTVALASLCFNRPDEALRHLDVEAVLAPRGLSTMFSLACRVIAWLLKGDNQQALDWADKCVRLNPAWSYSWFLKAMALHRLGRADERDAALRRWRTFDPGASPELLKTRSRYLPYPAEIRALFDEIQLPFLAREAADA